MGTLRIPENVGWYIDGEKWCLQVDCQPVSGHQASTNRNSQMDQRRIKYTLHRSFCWLFFALRHFWGSGFAMLEESICAVCQLVLAHGCSLMQEMLWDVSRRSASMPCTVILWFLVARGAGSDKISLVLIDWEQRFLFEKDVFSDYWLFSMYTYFYFSLDYLWPIHFSAYFCIYFVSLITFSPLSFNHLSVYCRLFLCTHIFAYLFFVFMNLYVLVIIDFSFSIFFVYLCFSPSLFWAAKVGPGCEVLLMIFVKRFLGIVRFKMMDVPQNILFVKSGWL